MSNQIAFTSGSVRDREVSGPQTDGMYAVNGDYSNAVFGTLRVVGTIQSPTGFNRSAPPVHGTRSSACCSRASLPARTLTTSCYAACRLTGALAPRAHGGAAAPHASVPPATPSQQRED